MNRPQIVSRDEWHSARKTLLAKEKAVTRERDALASERRNMPMVRIEKDYIFDGPSGQPRLRDLFGTRRQLIIYHFMFDPAWDVGCPSCSHCADNFAGSIVHLAAQDTAFVVISRAPLAKIAPFKQRMGWTFPWLSSFNSDFNYDFQVTLDEMVGSTTHNFASVQALIEVGKLWTASGEMPGVSVFLRDGDVVYLTYSAYQRGLDLLLNTYNYLDLTPIGRQDSEGNPQGWIRHHDLYAA